MADAEIDLLRSSLYLLALKGPTWGPMHGYAISEWIENAAAIAGALRRAGPATA